MHHGSQRWEQHKGLRNNNKEKRSYTHTHTHTLNPGGLRERAAEDWDRDLLPPNTKWNKSLRPPTSCAFLLGRSSVSPLPPRYFQRFRCRDRGQSDGERERERHRRLCSTPQTHLKLTHTNTHTFKYSSGRGGGIQKGGMAKMARREETNRLSSSTSAPRRG